MSHFLFGVKGVKEVTAPFHSAEELKTNVLWLYLFTLSPFHLFNIPHRGIIGGLSSPFHSFTFSTSPTGGL